jgi:hypothetical protein
MSWTFTYCGWENVEEILSDRDINIGLDNFLGPEYKGKLLPFLKESLSKDNIVREFNLVLASVEDNHPLVYSFLQKNLGIKHCYDPILAPIDVRLEYNRNKVN